MNPQIPKSRHNLLHLLFRYPFDIIGETAKFIWHPPIEFGHLLKFEKNDQYGGSKSVFFKYHGNHTFAYGEKFKLTISCQFRFEAYPFDSHECPVEFGDFTIGKEKLTYNSASISYGNTSTFITSKIGDPPIIIDHLSFPFEFQLEAMPAFEKSNGNMNFSNTGMLLKLNRNSFGQLLGGYYYPTGTFALISMISFLIKPDIVSK